MPPSTAASDESSSRQATGRVDQAEHQRGLAGRLGESKRVDAGGGHGDFGHGTTLPRRAGSALPSRVGSTSMTFGRARRRRTSKVAGLGADKGHVRQLMGGMTR